MMPLLKSKSLTKALTKIALDLGADLALDKNLNKLKDKDSDKSVRQYNNVGRRDRDRDRERSRRYDDDEEDSEEEYEAQQRRRRRNSTSRPGPPLPAQARYYEYDDDDRSYRRAPPPLITAPGPSSSSGGSGAGSRSNGYPHAGPQLIQPAAGGVAASAYAYDEYGNPYAIQPAARRAGSSAEAQGSYPRSRASTSRNGSMEDALPRARRGSSMNQDRPHVAFADEVDERDRAERPIPFRHGQQHQQASQIYAEPRAMAPPPPLPPSISAPSAAAVSSRSSSQSSTYTASPNPASSATMETHATASIGGSGIPLREITYAARCASYVYNLTSQQQAEAFLRSADSRPSHPVLLDVIFDNPPDNIRNCALFRRKSDNVLFLAVRGSGKRGSEWATDILRNVVSGSSSLEEVTPLLLQDGSVLYAHAGLLQYVLAMMRQVIELLEKRAAAAAAKYGPPRLVVCGHSSGGAIASLIYIMLEHNYQTILDRFRTIHCISFGSPPCVRAQDIITSRPHDGMFAVIMNGDPIPRMDRAYAADILAKYPLQVSSLYSNKSYAAAPTDAVEGTLLSIAQAVAGKDLEVPTQATIPAGKMVLLDPQITDIWDLKQKDLEESAFYNIGVHGMPLHLQCLERLEANHPDMVLD
ncbi:hypothetical protein OC834_002008 [Tilletia horrida]|nr:hypothetical protein OC834_002008 [Tilletia horrida]